MRQSTFIRTSFLGVLFYATVINAAGTATLPYATYQATQSASASGNGYYRYNNIRFADPPNGTLRFKNPVAPTTTETAIQDGSYGQTCYQLEQGQNSAAANQGEDCLFLDVVMPDDIPEGTTLPVLLYFYGGGFHSGQKEIYDGAPLVDASNNSIIYVIPNYRVGAFGWLGQFGDTHPGLMDQVAAAEWVQTYIHLFGGDPTRVTAVGHSAGGGSMLAHLISNGGEGSVPFAQAALMSPALSPLTPDQVAVRNQEMLEFFGYESYTLDQILALPASAINDMTGHIGARTWSPIMDGDYMREWPGIAFQAGRYHQNIPMLTGFLADEAHDYTPTTSPYEIDGSADVRNISYDTKDLMTSFFSTLDYNLSSSVIDQVWELYPLINNTDLYYTIFGKYDRILSEILMECNTYGLAEAFPVVYNWYFDVPPSYHAQENPYLFLGGDGTGSTSSYTINSTLSFYMKRWLVGLVMENVNTFEAEGVPTWDQFGVAQQAMEIGNANVGMIADPAVNDRCVFWQTNTS